MLALFTPVPSGLRQHLALSDYSVNIPASNGGQTNDVSD